jgi:hypothetical protein
MMYQITLADPHTTLTDVILVSPQFWAKIKGTNFDWRTFDTVWMNNPYVKDVTLVMS